MLSLLRAIKRRSRGRERRITPAPVRTRTRISRSSMIVSARPLALPSPVSRESDLHNLFHAPADFTAPRSPSSSDDERAARRASKKAKKPPQKSILNTIDTIDTIDVLNVHDVEEEEQTQRAMPCFSATSDQTGGWGGVDLASMAAKGEGGRVSGWPSHLGRPSH